MSRRPSSQNRIDTKGHQFTQKKPKSKLKTVKLDEAGSEPPTKKLRPLSVRVSIVSTLGAHAAQTSIAVESSNFRSNHRRRGLFCATIAVAFSQRTKGCQRKEKGNQSSGRRRRRQTMGGQVRANFRGLLIRSIRVPKLIHIQAELAVHKRKVEDVRRWLLEAFEGGPSAKLRKYRVRGFWSLALLPDRAWSGFSVFSP